MTSIWVPRIFHSVMFISYLYGCLFHITLQEKRWKLAPETASLRFGSWKFLTYWNLVAHCVFFGLMTVIDFLPSNSSLKNQLRKLSHSLSSGICVPFGIFVFTMFWGLYFYDRELIFPKALEKIYPLWLNHLSHTAICPAILYECYLNSHVCVRKSSLPFFMAMGLGYLGWMFFLGLSFDIWVYPVLQRLNLAGRIGFMGISAVCLLGFFIFGEKLTSSLARSNVQLHKQRRR